MRIYKDKPWQTEPLPRALALGFFDGIHLGHQELLRELQQVAQRQQLQATIFTFTAAPAQLFDPSQSFPGLLMSCDRRLNLLSTLAQADIVAVPLETEIYDLEAEQFLEVFLCELMQVRQVIVGADFSFGRAARGRVELLSAFCQQRGIGLTVVPDFLIGGRKVSSRRIRQALRLGELETAKLLLGNDYGLETVCQVQLDQRHYRLQMLSPQLLLPPPGVYTVRLELADSCPVAQICLKPSETEAAVIELRLAEGSPLKLPCPSQLLLQLSSKLCR